MKFNVMVPPLPTYGALSTSTGTTKEVEGDDFYVDNGVLYVYEKATQEKQRALKAAFSTWVWIKQVPGD